MPAPTNGPRTFRDRISGVGGAAGNFLRRLYEKAGEDNIFFMAGAIAFNVLVAFIPLVLAVLGIAGFVLASQDADPAARLTEYLAESIPTATEAFHQLVSGILGDVAENSTGFLSLGTLLFIWLATRLIGTLRTALREIFDIQQDRGIVAGKIFDIKMVFAAGTLFAANVVLTIVLGVIQRRGLNALERLPLGLGDLPFASLYSRVLAFATIWVMFLLIYRYLPARRIGWSTAVIAATFTAIFYELLKEAFTWYAVNVNYQSTYGTIGTVIALVLWIYYVAVVFILGGEVAQLYAMSRIRRRQRERLS